MCRRRCSIARDMRSAGNADLWGEQVPWLGDGDDELGRHTRFRQRCASVRTLCAGSALHHHHTRPGGARLPIRGRKATEAAVAFGDGLAPRTRPGAWAHLMVRDGEKGPVENRDGRTPRQTRLERKRTGPESGWCHALSPRGRGTLEGQASRNARDQDARYGIATYLTPTVWRPSTEGPSLGNWHASIKAEHALNQL